jgi:hypothetical protein
LALKRKSRADRMQAKFKAIKAGLKARMHEPVNRQGLWLRQVVKGWFNYHAVPTNVPALRAFQHHVTAQWRRSLSRRSQKDPVTWTRIAALAQEWLPKPRILHPGLRSASPSDTRGGSRMRETRPYGSVRGALGNELPTAIASRGNRRKAIRRRSSAEVLRRQRFNPSLKR